MRDWRKDVGRYLPQEIRDDICALNAQETAQACEVRLRSGRRGIVCLQTGSRSLSELTDAQIKDCASAMLGHALHARERELREGFVTLPGGQDRKSVV